MSSPCHWQAEKLPDGLLCLMVTYTKSRKAAGAENSKNHLTPERYTKIPWKTLSPKQKQNPGKYTGLKMSVLWTHSWAVLQSGGCFKPFPAPATQ